MSRHSFVGCINHRGKERIFGIEQKILDVVDAGEGQLKTWALLTMMDDVGERMWGMVVECSRRDILFLILRWYVLFARLWGSKDLDRECDLVGNDLKALAFRLPLGR